MARNRRRTSRKRSRSRFRRKYRKYRKLYKSSRKIKKRISGRRKIPGNSTRVRIKTEQKFLQLSSDQAALFGTAGAEQPVILYVTSPTVNTVQGVPLFGIPAQGTGASEVTGNSFVYQFLDLRFACKTNQLQGWQQDLVRLMVVTQRHNTSAFNTNLFVEYNGFGFPRNILTPINTRFWKIHMDKTFPIASGSVPATVAGAQDAYGATLASPIRTFKFIMPFKQLCNRLVAGWTPERLTYILGMTGAQDTYQLNMFNARLYFKDP